MDTEIKIVKQIKQHEHYKNNRKLKKHLDIIIGILFEYPTKQRYIEKILERLLTLMNGE